MRYRAHIAVMLAAALPSISSLSAMAFRAPEVTLTVLDPRGEIAPVPVVAPRPRISDLSGKRIGIYWNGKSGGDHFWNVIEQLIRQKLPSATIVRYNGAYDIGEPLAAKMAEEVDTFLYGAGD